MPKTPDNNPGNKPSEYDEPLSENDYEAASAVSQLLYLAYRLVVAPIEIIRRLSKGQLIDLHDQAQDDLDKK